MTSFIIFLSITSFVLAYDSSACDAPVGHFCSSINNPSHFVKCGKGKYQDERGQTSCKSCKDGEYNIQTGQSKCKVCPVGHSCLWKNKSPVKCRDGLYQEQKGKTIGKVCPTIGLEKLKRKTRDLIPNQFSAIRRAAKYAQQAYEEVNPPDSRLLDTGDRRVKGFVKYEDNTIVVSFQGSADLIDWKNNLKFLKKSYPGCPNCKVHIGFFDSYSPLKQQMLDKVNAFFLLNPNSKVLVTGHSLGGAMATLAAVDLVKIRYQVDLITFGSPRVGNKEFKELVDSNLNGLNLRVTYKRDPVTVIPPQLLGYRHVGLEIYCVGPGQCNEYPRNEPPNKDATRIRGNIFDHFMTNYLSI